MIPMAAIGVTRFTPLSVDWQGPLPASTVRLRWTCTLFSGPPRWHGTEVFEPDECGEMFDTIEDAEDFRACGASARCPTCGGELTHDMDMAVLVMETP